MTFESQAFPLYINLAAPCFWLSSCFWLAAGLWKESTSTAIPLWVLPELSQCKLWDGGRACLHSLSSALTWCKCWSRDQSLEVLLLSDSSQFRAHCCVTKGGAVCFCVHYSVLNYWISFVSLSSHIVFCSFSAAIQSGFIFLGLSSSDLPASSTSAPLFKAI